MKYLSEKCIMEVLSMIVKHSDSQLDMQPPSHKDHVDFSILDNLEREALRMESLFKLFKNSLLYKISNMLRHRNTLLPIYKLPNEILSFIFQLVQATETSIERKFWVIQDLAGVSSRWFSVIYTTPSLWSVITSKRSPSQMKTIIQRSKGTGLKIHINEDEDGSFDQVKDILTPHSARWEILHVVSSRSKTIMKHIQTTGSLPRLEVFKVEGPYREIELPGVIWNNAPKLRELYIQPLSFPLHAPSLASLQTLKFTAAIKVSSEQWKTILHGSPRLRFIEAMGDESCDLSGTFHRFSASLPDLQELHLRTLHPSTMGGLISSICSSSQIGPLIKLRDPRCNWAADGMDVFFSGETQPQSLMQLIDKMTWLRIRYDGPREGMRFQGGGQSQKVNLDFADSDPIPVSYSFFREMLRRRNLHMLESLSLEGDHVFDNYDLVFQAFAGLPWLKRLTLMHPDGEPDHHGYPGKFELISQTLSGPCFTAAGAELSWVLPQLRELTIGVSGAYDLVVPIIEARSDLGIFHESEDLPVFLKKFHLRCVPSHLGTIMPIEQSLVDHLHMMTNGQSEITIG
ncbi:hypothetical protein FRC03_009282 [Tulasnella sp. 419]|nr:hypothetical protein FRC03_009282 [Tulasnella sp. 419]